MSDDWVNECKKNINIEPRIWKKNIKFVESTVIHSWVNIGKKPRWFSLLSLSLCINLSVCIFISRHALLPHHKKTYNTQSRFQMVGRINIFNIRKKLPSSLSVRFVRYTIRYLIFYKSSLATWTQLWINTKWDCLLRAFRHEWMANKNYVRKLLKTNGCLLKIAISCHFVYEMGKKLNETL